MIEMPDGFCGVTETESTKTIFASPSVVMVVSKSTALTGTKITVMSSPSCKSKVDVEAVAKHGTNSSQTMKDGSSH